jgi:hypothetical protein
MTNAINAMHNAYIRYDIQVCYRSTSCLTKSCSIRYFRLETAAYPHYLPLTQPGMAFSAQLSYYIFLADVTQLPHLLRRADKLIKHYGMVLD